MADVANITIGPSKLFIAASGTVEPTLTGAESDFAAFTELGLTLDGIEWDYTSTWKDIMADELMGIAKKKLISHKLVVTAKLEETTLQNLSYAIPSSTLSGSTLTIGTRDAPEFVLGWIGPSRSTATRECLVYRVVSIAAVKAHYQRKDLVTYSVQFEALSDTSKTAPADLATYKDF